MITHAAAHEPPLFENGGFQFIGLQIGLFLWCRCLRCDAMQLSVKLFTELNQS